MARKRRKGAGRYCVTVTKPRTRGSRGRGGLSFSTVCYKTKKAAFASLERRATNFYTAMIHPPGKKRRKKRK